jgi:hypothetical protein
VVWHEDGIYQNLQEIVIPDARSWGLSAVNSQKDRKNAVLHKLATYKFSGSINILFSKKNKVDMCFKSKAGKYPGLTHAKKDFLG